MDNKYRINKTVVTITAVCWQKLLPCISPIQTFNYDVAVVGGALWSWDFVCATMKNAEYTLHCQEPTIPQLWVSPVRRESVRPPPRAQVLSWWICRNTICVRWRMIKPHPEHKEQPQRLYTPNRDSDTWCFSRTSPDGGGGWLYAVCVARSRRFSLGRFIFSFTAGGQARSRGRAPAEPTTATSAALSLSEKKETQTARYVEWNCVK